MRLQSAAFLFHVQVAAAQLSRRAAGAAAQPAQPQSLVPVNPFPPSNQPIHPAGAAAQQASAPAIQPIHAVGAAQLPPTAAHAAPAVQPHAAQPPKPVSALSPVAAAAVPTESTTTTDAAQSTQPPSSPSADAQIPPGFAIVRPDPPATTVVAALIGPFFGAVLIFAVAFVLYIKGVFTGTPVDPLAWFRKRPQSKPAAVDVAAPAAPTSPANSPPAMPIPPVSHAVNPHMLPASEQPVSPRHAHLRIRSPSSPKPPQIYADPNAASRMAEIQARRMSRLGSFSFSAAANQPTSPQSRRRSSALTQNIGDLTTILDEPAPTVMAIPLRVLETKTTQESENAAANQLSQSLAHAGSLIEQSVKSHARGSSESNISTNQRLSYASNQRTSQHGDAEAAQATQQAAPIPAETIPEYSEWLESVHADTVLQEPQLSMTDFLAANPIPTTTTATAASALPSQPTDTRPNTNTHSVTFSRNLASDSDRTETSSSGSSGRSSGNSGRRISSSAKRVSKRFAEFSNPHGSSSSSASNSRRSGMFSSNRRSLIMQDYTLQMQIQQLQIQQAHLMQMQEQAQAYAQMQTQNGLFSQTSQETKQIPPHLIVPPRSDTAFNAANQGTIIGSVEPSRSAWKLGGLKYVSKEEARRIRAQRKAAERARRSILLSPSAADGTASNQGGRTSNATTPLSPPPAQREGLFSRMANGMRITTVSGRRKSSNRKSVLSSAANGNRSMLGEQSIGVTSSVYDSFHVW